ncbi:MAG: hypothetical protein K0R49_76 [Burkholderiales bacterium]|jgi:hypothetical protein|nr:hypothetical protein [Burkholderiales bacterium]
MLHASNILQQSLPFDKNSVDKKFTDLINGILNQLKEEKFDKLLDSTIKQTPCNSRRKLINGMIKGRCENFDLKPPVSNGYSQIKKERLKNLTLNEQFYLLAHIDFKSIDNWTNPRPDNLNSEFVSIVQSIISEKLLKLVDNFTY